MPFVVFDKATGRFVTGARWEAPAYDASSQVLVETSDTFPDDDERWDGKGGVRKATQEEIEAARPPDWRGFELALAGIFVENTVALLCKYGAMLWGLRDERSSPSARAGLIQGAVLLANGTGDITKEQFDAVKQAAADFRIPVSL